MFGREALNKEVIDSVFVFYGEEHAFAEEHCIITLHGSLRTALFNMFHCEQKIVIVEDWHGLILKNVIEISFKLQYELHAITLLEGDKQT